MLAGAAADVVERHRRCRRCPSATRRGALGRGAAARGGRGARWRRAPARGAAAGAGGRGGGRARPPARVDRPARRRSRVMRPPTPVPVIGRRVEAVLGDQAAHDRRERGGPRRRRRCRRRRGGAGGAGCGRRAPRAGGSGGRRGRPARAAVGRRGLRAAAAAGRGRLGARRGGAPPRPPAGAAPPAPGASPTTAQHGADVDGVALGHPDLGEVAGRPATAPRSRPCRWTPRRASSSSATVSPTCLNHFVIVPSVTVSPSWGIVMSAMRRLLLSTCASWVVGRQCSERPVRASTLSPNSSLSDGCGWMNWATSSTVASQLTAR